MLKILIVEPDATRQRQLRTILSSIGHKSGEIETVPDERGALSALRKARFDCVFTAVDTEAVNGMELLGKIKGGASTKHLPVVVYSAEVTKDQVIGSHQAGASGFLAYPFSVSDVESAITKAVP